MYQYSYRRAHLVLREVGGLIKIVIFIVCSMTISVTGEVLNIFQVSIVSDNVISCHFTTIFLIHLESLVLLSELRVICPP